MDEQINQTKPNRGGNAMQWKRNRLVHNTNEALSLKKKKK
jgi:hypothetical protein